MVNKSFNHYIKIFIYINLALVAASMSFLFLISITPKTKYNIRSDQMDSKQIIITPCTKIMFDGITCHHTYIQREPSNSYYDACCKNGLYNVYNVEPHLNINLVIELIRSIKGVNSVHIYQIPQRIDDADPIFQPNS